ncbi:transcriptional regulator [Ktedonosporobacter rubrisoli]|uniref:Transcriptional regulator n=1 Tax=Ktedonosporobacter rubrisoli TaxID=2509675 RepID=A0A4P6JLI0_KTERU|nr:transcriptional regulator [Ktedonosporobacter rubrisoli]QBD75852.1 transcriptional regulator [Ktedonosporobacter rubrisoli]
MFGLNAAERNHLFVLARQQLPADPFPLTDNMNPALQSILDALGIYPATVANQRWDIVAWNQAMCSLYTDLGKLSSRERNALWFMFTNPLQRALLVNWEKEAQGMLASFRAGTERYVGEPWFKALVTDLQHISPEFRAWWPRHDIQIGHMGPIELNHPLVGRLVLQSTPLQVANAPNLRLAIYTPLPEADTAKKLAQLAEAGEKQIAAL